MVLGLNSYMTPPPPYSKTLIMIDRSRMQLSWNIGGKVDLERHQLQKSTPTNS